MSNEECTLSSKARQYWNGLVKQGREEEAQLAFEVTGSELFTIALRNAELSVDQCAKLTESDSQYPFEHWDESKPVEAMFLYRLTTMLEEAARGDCRIETDTTWFSFLQGHLAREAIKVYPAAEGHDDLAFVEFCRKDYQRSNGIKRKHEDLQKRYSRKVRHKVFVAYSRGQAEWDEELLGPAPKTE